MKKILIFLFLALSLTVSAEEFVPVENLKGIKANAAKAFPNDYVTQAYVIKMQKKSYIQICNFVWDKRVGEKVKDKIITSAFKQFGKNNDFMTMLYVMKTQQKSYLKLL